jgi:hypothetical protein
MVQLIFPLLVSSSEFDAAAFGKARHEVPSAVGVVPDCFRGIRLDVSLQPCSDNSCGKERPIRGIPARIVPKTELVYQITYP